MAVGKSADAVSNEAGKRDAIRNLRRAVENKTSAAPNSRTLAALAPILRTTPAWLLDGVGPEDPEAEDGPSIPVLGHAGAGGAVHIGDIEPSELGRIPPIQEMNDRTVAVEIRGESLGRLFDRWYAVYDDLHDPPTELSLNRLCVVGLADGRVFIKKLVKGRGKRFTLESNYDPPIYDVEVKWAAPVKTIIPR